MAHETSVWFGSHVKIEIFRRDLIFKKPSRTSRDVLTNRPVWYILLNDGSRRGLGECAPVFGLSPESEEDISRGFEKLMSSSGLPDPSEFAEIPSLRFALEMALINVEHGAWEWFPGEFSSGKKAIEINGLVWMNAADQMLQDAFDLVEKGFSCIKFKVGALDFGSELDMLSRFREKVDISKVSVRLDANGAFLPAEAEAKLRQLAEFSIHSIEQPVRPEYSDVLADLCDKRIIPVALDEQLIGVLSREAKVKMLRNIAPDYLVIKPTLVGGFSQALEWSLLASEMGMGCWITSMLESNPGLAAIAQWTSNFGTDLPQGLGTGSLYLNNLNSPVEMSSGFLTFMPEQIPLLNTIDEIQRSGIRVF